MPTIYIAGLSKSKRQEKSITRKVRQSLLRIENLGLTEKNIKEKVKVFRIGSKNESISVKCHLTDRMGRLEEDYKQAKCAIMESIRGGCTGADAKKAITYFLLKFPDDNIGHISATK
jgi:hypothetical protein